MSGFVYIGSDSRESRLFGDQRLAEIVRKGITAECALALATKTGAKMALIGRSAANNFAVSQTLERFENEGITFCYYSCDVTDFDAVNKLVEKVTLELGAITAVVHGAGANKPCRVEQVSLTEAIAEVSPKLLGADNLLKALASTPPKLIIAFSSVIGVTGMPGNAWYAFANKSLDIMLRHFESNHRETQILSIAYSVWGEVGMGVRMGSVQYLERMGIGAIPTNTHNNHQQIMFDNNNIDNHNYALGSVVISGASSGIGEACAIHLDKLGYQVFAGVPAIWLAKKFGCRIHAINLAEDNVTRAKQAVKREKLEHLIHVYQMDAADMNFPTNFFEALLDWGMILLKMRSL